MNKIVFYKTGCASTILSKLDSIRFALSLTMFVVMSVCTASAQTVIEIPFVQYAPLTVVADEVTIALSGSGVVVGSSVSVEGGDGNYTYSWTDSGGTVLATTPTYKMTQAGRYYLVVTDGQGCSVSTLFTATGTTGISLDEQLAMEDEGLKQVRVFDASGRLLATYPYPSSITPHPSSLKGAYLLVYIYADGKARAVKVGN